MSGMNRYNAAKAAGYSESTAKGHTDRLEKSVKIADVLERQGLTDRYLANKLLQLTEAQKVIGYLHNYKKADNGVIEKIKPDETVSNDFVEVPDWSAQAKGVELTLKLKSHLINKTEHSGEIKGGGQTKVIIINPKDYEPKSLNGNRIKAFSG